MKRLTYSALLAATCVLLAPLPLLQAGLQDESICETDSDCALHCPPPADDPDCDGGPQDATDGRGNYGSQP